MHEFKALFSDHYRSYVVPRRSQTPKKVWKESIKVFLVLCGLYDTIKVEEFVSIRQNFAFIFSGRFPILYRAAHKRRCTDVLSADNPLYMQTIEYNILNHIKSF